MKRIWQFFNNRYNPKAIKVEDLRFASRDDNKLDQFLNQYRNTQDIKLLTKPIGSHHLLSFYDNVI